MEKFVWVIEAPNKLGNWGVLAVHEGEFGNEDTRIDATDVAEDFINDSHIAWVSDNINAFGYNDDNQLVVRMRLFVVHEDGG